MPSHSPPPFIKRSNLGDTAGYVDVNKHSLQHTKYPNVFAAGDSSNLPVSKTASAIFSQFPIVVHNVQCMLESKPVVNA